MDLIKIGTLNIPSKRWEDALILFDKIYVVSLKHENEVQNDRIVYLKLCPKSFFKHKLTYKLISACRKFRSNKFVVNSFILLLRAMNIGFIRNIEAIRSAHIHSSYNDFDDSGILTIMLYPAIKNKTITRAYKETRPEKNFIEELSFRLADRIVLNSNENKNFFKNKHKNISWDDKNVVIGLDEDWRQKKIIQNITIKKKLSLQDKKKHIVILAGRVFSDCCDKRSGTRLCYIAMIKKLIHSGLVVHLHTFKIIEDKNGVDQYKKLEKKFPNDFYIEKTLDFNNFPKSSYEILSRYDYGVLHNIDINNTCVSPFDRINIPHRFYDYQIAEVIPVVKRNDTVLMEKLFNKTQCGLIIDNFDELSLENNIKIKFFKKSFYEYISALYL